MSDIVKRWKEVKIYSLSDPLTNQIKYVGKTIYAPEQRLKEHIHEAEKNRFNTYKNNWIKSLLKQNIVPTVEVLDIVEEDNWQFWEQWWINLLRSWGYKLTNLTDGGEGIKSAVHQQEIIAKIKYKLSLIENPSKRPEVKEKIRQKMIGRVFSEEWRKKMSENGKGKKMPQSMKDKRRQYMLNNELPAWNKGQSKETNDTLKRMSENMKKKIASGEYISPMKGKTHSEQVRKKLSEIRKGKVAWSKAVEQTDLLTGEVKIWESANQANRYYYGKTGDNIASFIRKNKVYKNFVFKYINE